MFKMNDAIKNTKVCPAIILALNRIAKLNALIIYEKISINISIGNNIKGHSGINIFKNCKLLIYIPKKNIDKQVLNDKYIIIIKWLVKAMPKGNKLNKLLSKTKLNSVNMKGKNK